MFESDLDKNAELKNSQRRVFLIASGTTLAGLFAWSMRMPRILQAATTPDEPHKVTVVLFSDNGKRLKKVRMMSVVKSEEEWKKQLTPVSFEITRQAGTELAYTGQYWNLHDKGLYRCICCDTALFSSSTKFDSGTGWPSFWAPIASENVRESTDFAIGIARTAVACTLCNAHLGHVFDDGPAPTHLRYCMNSAALKFIKQA